jgi:hypothetical protein
MVIYQKLFIKGYLNVPILTVIPEGFYRGSRST